jgi:hypothetical protein
MWLAESWDANSFKGLQRLARGCGLSLPVKLWSFGQAGTEILIGFPPDRLVKLTGSLNALSVT